VVVGARHPGYYALLSILKADCIAPGRCTWGWDDRIITDKVVREGDRVIFLYQLPIRDHQKRKLQHTESSRTCIAAMMCSRTDEAKN
jgi:hypothetical protein